MFHVKQKPRKLAYTFHLDEYMIKILQQVAKETLISQAELIRRALEKEFNSDNYRKAQ